MEQLEYWQAIEDGAEFEEEPKKRKRRKEKDKAPIKEVLTDPDTLAEALVAESKELKI